MNNTHLRTRWTVLMLAAASSQDVLAADSNWQTSGFVKQEVAYSYQREDFEWSKLRTSVGMSAVSNFNANVKIKVDTSAWYDAAYQVDGRDNFTNETLDVHETDFRVNEAYVDIDLPRSLNLRIGRQYFSWGETMGATQISDIGNPRDFKELGLQSVEFARLPIGSTKLSYAGESWEYSLIAIHEFRANEFGAEGSEFDPLLALRSPQTVIRDPQEPKTVGNNGLLTRLFVSQEWGDLSCFWGKTYDGTPVLTVQNFDFNTGVTTFLPEFNKVESYGFFGNVIAGSWSLVFDVARRQNTPIQVGSDFIGEQLRAGDTTPISSQRRRELRSMLGFEFSGWSEMLVSMEYQRQYIENYDRRLGVEQTRQQVSLFVSRDFMRDTLTTTLWLGHDLNDQSNQFRVELDYAYSDSLRFNLSVGGIDAGNRESFFYNYRNTDRVTVGAKYSF